MITLTDLKQLDPTKLDLSQLDLSKLDPRRLDLSGCELGKLDPRNFDLPALPAFEMPAFETPIDVDRLTGFARDAAYVGVGVAVIAVQRADARRREVTEQVTTQLRKLADAVA